MAEKTDPTGWLWRGDGRCLVFSPVHTGRTFVYLSQVHIAPDSFLVLTLSPETRGKINQHFLWLPGPKGPKLNTLNPA